MARMTEEEADALDEEITNADITLKSGGRGIFTRHRDLKTDTYFGDAGAIHP